MGGSASKRQKKREKGGESTDPSYSQLMAYVHDNVIGDGIIFDGPYGKRSGELCTNKSLMWMSEIIGNLQFNAVLL